MIVDRMSPDDKFRELNMDSIWINSMCDGWYKKYAASLKKKRDKKVTYIDKKRYVTPNKNSVYVLFFVEKSDYNNRYTTLIWYLLFELSHRNGSTSFILYTTDLGAVTISSHAIQRMHERSGKSIFKLLEEDMISSKKGIMCWIPYNYNGNSNERICAWGDGVLLGIKLSHREYVVTTYLDSRDIHSNQMQQSYESLVGAQQLFEQQRDIESLYHPKLTGTYIKCAA